MTGINSRAQGQSEAVTEAKERGISAACTINLKIFSGFIRKHAKTWAGDRACYMHFDLNAGSGMNDKVGCIGSPLAFLGAARACGVERYRAFFCDIDRSAVRQLLRRTAIAEDPRSFVMHGDNASLCDAIPRIVRDIGGENPGRAIGSILVDPNGTDVPVAGLAWVAEQCPQLDIFINVAAAALKRNRAQSVAISDLLMAVQKDHWLIREPIGQWQWVMLHGRNLEIREHRALGFYDLRSRKGEEIFEVCEFTREQRHAFRNQQLDFGPP
jgi:three-Cys-motif partner protein